jgi:hypothetical protein
VVVIGRAAEEDGVLARRAAKEEMRAASWVSTAEKGRSDGTAAGEQGPRGWCSGRCRAVPFRCSKSAAVD